MSRTPRDRPAEDIVCRQLVELVTDYLEDALAPARRDAVERHLAGCDGCHGYVAQVRAMLRLTRRQQDAAVPADLLAALTEAFDQRP